ncbi:alpha/beta hydrolase, partial [bacterium]
MMFVATWLLTATLIASSVSERPLALTVHGTRIPAALDLPAHATAKGAVLVVPGAFNSDVDGNYPTQGFSPHTYADIARGLAARGYAALRYAKDGEGTGITLFDANLAAQHQDFSERIAIAQAALQALREAAGNSVPVTIAGHSEGGIVATLLAAHDPNIRGLIELEAPGQPILDLAQQQTFAAIADGERSGTIPPQTATTERALIVQAIAGIRAGIDPPPMIEPLITQYFGKPANVELAELRQEDRIDPAHAIANVHAPVLIVEGTADNVVPRGEAERLDAARLAAHLPTTL